MRRFADPYFGLSVSRVDPLPHQLEAVYDHLLKLVGVRFLLADDAGAGKSCLQVSARPLALSRPTDCGDDPPVVACTVGAGAPYADIGMRQGLD